MLCNITQRMNESRYITLIASLTQQLLALFIIFPRPLKLTLGTCYLAKVVQSERYQPAFANRPGNGQCFFMQRARPLGIPKPQFHIPEVDKGNSNERHLVLFLEY